MNSSKAGSLVDGLDHPEGVAWGQDGFLYAGGEAGQLYRIDIDSLTVEEYASTGGFILGIALAADGTVFACDPKRHEVVRVSPNGHTSVHSGGSAERRMVAPNYPVFASNGLLYVSDSGTWNGGDGCIFEVAPDGKTRVWSDEITSFPNGLALDASGSHLYVAESTGERVSRIPILADGRAGPPELVVGLAGTVPDGLAFDADGGLLISCYRPDRIYHLTVLGDLAVLAEDPLGTVLAAPTNVCFGGANLTRLFSANLGRWHIAEISVSVAGAPLNYPSFQGEKHG